MSNTTIEDVLKKHHDLYIVHPLWKSYAEAVIYPAMQEWASLQTPSNEKWVKASERLPEKEGQYYVLMEGWKGTAYFNGNRFETGDWIKIERIQWLDESTPIPIQTPCVELEKEVERLKGLVKSAHYAGWYNGMVNAYKHDFSWEEFQKNNNLSIPTDENQSKFQKIYDMLIDGKVDEVRFFIAEQLIH